MKKLFYILAMGLALASCNGDYDDWADPQSNPAEDAKSVAFTVAQAADINYASLTEETVQLFVPTIVAQDETVDTYVVKLFNADGDDSRTLTADAEGKVSVDDLKSAVQELFGKRPDTRTINLAITAYSDVAGQSIKNLGTSQAKVTLNTAPVSEGYTLKIVKNGSEILSEDLKQVGDGDVYDNPNFKVNFEIEEEDAEWYLLTKEGQKVGVVAGEDELHGNLTLSNEDKGPIPAGHFILTIDMGSYTYSIDDAPDFNEFIFMAGNSNGWGSPADVLRATDQSNGKYMGFMYLDGEFKFRSQEFSWDAPDWGGSMDALVAQGGNLPGPETAGYYQVLVDLKNLTCEINQITSISIIGTVNGDWNNDTELEYNVASRAWEGTVTLNAGEMKFRANHDWGINWGGTDLSDFTQGGANYVLAEGGTYFVQLFAWCDTRAYAVLTKQ